MSNDQRPQGSERYPPETDIDLSAAQPARIHNYLSGGVANFAVDREAVDMAATILPGGLDTVHRAIASMAAFQVRVVRHLVAEVGIRQFLKLGTVVPEGDDVHEIAQAGASGTRVLYVGDDPTVLAHAHSLRRSRPEGLTGYVHGRLQDVDAVLREAVDTLDLDQPVAILLPGSLAFVPDADDPHGLVARLVEALAPGSHMAVTHTSNDLRSERMQEAAEKFSTLLADSYVVRPRTEILRFFDGLELVGPGLVQLDQWRPPSAGEAGADEAAGEPGDDGGVPAPIYGGLGRKA